MLDEASFNLACPVCKGELKLSVEEENESEIVSGSLCCLKCDVHYPIVDTIPNLLPPEKTCLIRARG